MTEIQLKEKLKKKSKSTLGDLTPEETENALITALDVGSDAFKTIKAAAEASGLDEKVVAKMLAVVRKDHLPVLTELRTVRTGTLVGKLDDIADRALEHFSDDKLEAAGIKDLAIAVGIILDKRQLLKGEPTHILSAYERQEMTELMPMLVKEMGRRGMKIYQEYDMVDVTPPSPERSARPRGASTSFKDHAMKKIVTDKAESGEP